MLATHEARGTTFVLMDEGELASRSVAVLTGTVQEVRAAVDAGNGGVNTYVSIEPADVLSGAVPDGEVVIKESGGRTSDREETVFGSPQYSPGEQVLVFLSRNPDGSLHTTGMSMGKYRLSGADAAQLAVSRTFGSGVTVLKRNRGSFAASGVRPDNSLLEDVIARIHSAPADEGSAYSAPVQWQPKELGSLPREYQASYSYLASPARWFEPGNGQPVAFFVDPTGDPKIGPADSRAAVAQALATWSSINSTTLRLEDGGDTTPQPYAGCNGGNRVVFNDPGDEITDPTNCGGILAVGGYCASWESQTVDGNTYRRIGIGKVVLNNGWEKCAGWNACNLAEVITHELGHAIGLGHSEDGAATMSPSAHFDGRCATVETDDVVGALSLYADPSMPTFTPTSTPTITPTPLPTNTRAGTSTPTLRPSTPTRTPTVVRSRTATRTRTRTATPTRTRSIRPTSTRTPVSGVVRTATKTRTPYATRTRTLTRTPTRTKTPTRTRTATRTKTPTRTPEGLNEVSGDDTLVQSSASIDWVEKLISSWFRLDP